MYNVAEYINSYNSDRRVYGKVSTVKVIWLIIVIFFYLYNFPLNNFGIPFSSSKLVTVFAIINLCFNPAYIPQLFTNKYHRFINMVIFGLFMYILFFNFITHGAFVGGYQYPYIIILFSFECFLGGFYIIKTLANYNLRILLNIIIVVVVIQALIMMIAVVYNPLRLFILDTLKGWGGDMGADLKLKDFSFRGLALASDRKLGLAVLNAIVCNIIIYLSLTLKGNKKLAYTLYGIAFILTFISGMLAARTFYVAFAFIFVGFTFRSGNSIWRVLKFILFSVLLVFTIGAGILGNVADKETMIRLEAFSDWTFEAYDKYERTGEVKTGSSDELFYDNWQYLPIDAYSWWFGTEDRRTKDDGSVLLAERTDAGYLLMLNYVGILGCLAIYSFWLVIGSKANKLFLKKERMGTLIWLIILLLYVLEIKFQAVLGSYTEIKFMMLLYILGVERRNYFKNEYLYEQVQLQPNP